MFYFGGQCIKLLTKQNFLLLLEMLSSTSTEDEPGPSKSASKAGKCASRQKRRSTEGENSDDMLKQARMAFYQSHTESQRMFQEAQHQIILTQQEVRAYFQRLNKGKFIILCKFWWWKS